MVVYFKWKVSLPVLKKRKKKKKKVESFLCDISFKKRRKITYLKDIVSYGALEGGREEFTGWRGGIHKHCVLKAILS